MARFFTAAPLHARAAALRVTIGDGLRRYRGLLRQRDVTLLLGASLVSEVGDWFNTVALIDLSYRFGGGAVSVGVMLALRTVPRLLLQAPAGALVDRYPGRRLLVLSHLLMSVIATAFVLLIPVPALWLLYGLVVALESVATVSWPALRIQLVRQTPPDQFAAINGVLSIGLTGAQFVGPLLGALVLVGLGAGPVFVVNGLTFLVIAVVASRLGTGAGAPDVPSPAASGPPMGTPGGYRVLVGQRALLAFAAAALGVTIAVRGAIALFIVRADQLGLGEAGPGYFYAAVALGAIIGGALAGIGSHAGRPALRVAAGAMVACTIALACFGAMPGVLAALAALAIAGGATNVYEVAGLTYFQHRLPATLYGRFMAMFMLALGLGGIIGAVGGPLLQTRFSVATALELLALPGAALALGLLLALRRTRDAA